ncbi:MAG: hypothetical protein H0U49_06695 [Parachlamydiaceae bacterium]|nr:hypothetical protein [Parachlamydiaceae bacterium]
MQEKLEEILNFLLNGKKLPEKNKDHDIVGNYIYHRGVISHLIYC